MSRIIGAQEFYGEKISSSDYYICTDAKFESIKDNEKDSIELFEKMKQSGKYEYTHSPKSTSEYLVDETDGVVYRLANHWGRCASCKWYCDVCDGSYILAKCEFRNFKRTDYPIFLLNPKFVVERNKKIKSCVVNIIKFFDKINKDVILDKKAKSAIGKKINQISQAFDIDEENKILIKSLVNKYKNIP